MSKSYSLCFFQVCSTIFITNTYEGRGQMTFDTIIIGSGVAGIAAAKRLVQNGEKVAIVENWEWGGTVVNRGSTAKKVFLASEEVKQSVDHLLHKGFDSSLEIQWGQTAQFKNTIIKNNRQQLLDELDKLSITKINGQATFISAHEIEVNNQTYTSERFIIATGAHPRELEINGKEHFLYSHDFLDLDELPNDLIIVGAGIISFAFAGIANAAGANVHVLQHDNRALAAFDQELVHELIQILKQRGVHFHFNEPISDIELTSTNQYHIKTSNGLNLMTDKIFCVAGRLPNTQNLGLETIEVSYGDKGIHVNDYFQTTLPHIYAIGDCCDAPVPKLANYAVLQGHYAAKHLLGKKNDQPVGILNYPVPAMSVFSNPKLALAGMSTVEAELNPDEYQIVTIDMSSWLPYHRFNQATALAKLVIEKSNNTVVGITSLSDQADSLINYAALILNQKITKEEMEEYLFAYPTLATNLHQLMG